MLKQAQQFIIILLFLYGAILNGQTTNVIDENFSGGALPAGWSNVNNGGTTGQIWQFNDPGGRNITAGNFVGNYAILDSDNYGASGSQNASLLTPTFNASLYETLNLEFDFQYREYAAVATVVESCVVDVFNGITWVEVFRREVGSENYTGAELIAPIDIKAVVGSATNAQVRFTYVGAYDWWWAVGNVKVSGNLIVPTNTSYLGPGGIGGVDGSSNLVLWSKAENITAPSNLDPIETWPDASGYSSDLTQPNTDLRPLFLENSLNGYNTVRFDATAASNSLLGKRLVKTAFTNFPTSAISGFYVNKTASATEGGDGVLSYASAGRNNDFLLFNSNNLTFYRNNLNRRSSLDVSTANWNIIGFSWQSAGGVANISRNGTESGGLASMNSGVNIVSGGSLALAGEQDSVDIFGTGNDDGNYALSQSHQGEFSEVIIFNTFINQARRTIVSNYLSAKYNIAITAGTDFYTQDDSGSGNFDFDVAGIGQATDGSNHTDSQGTGIVRVYNPSNLDNGRFLFWGRNNKDALTFATNTSSYKERISTNWRVSKTNNLGDNLGNVSFILDLNGVDISAKQACAPLQLIVDNNSDLLSPTAIYELTDIGSGMYKVNNVVFADNDYFTIEYIDTIVVDGTKFYNGSGTANVPNTSDSCYKFLVKSTATGTLSLTENANVREIEVEAGGKLVINSEKGLTVTNGIQLAGEIRLIDKSQLIQTHSGASTITGSGKLYIDQNSEVESLYLYNYFSSPVVTVGQSTYTVGSVMKDGTTPTSSTSAPPAITFIGGLDGNFSGSPIQLPNRWIYTYDDLGSGTYGYDNNSGVGSTIAINPGKGYLFKGPGRAQNYTFEGKPNDGNYTYSGIPADVNILVGNPYPSAFNIQTFLTDNSAIGDTAYLWQQADVDNAEGSEGHYSSGYNGDYAIINTSTSTVSTLLTQVNYVREAEEAILGGSATVVGDKVELTTATDNISFNFNGLSKSVDSLFIVYKSTATKSIDIDINGLSYLVGVNLPSTAGVLDTLKVELAIVQDDIVLLKSNDSNTTALDKVFGRQKYTFTAPPFNHLAIAQGFFFYTHTSGSLVFNNGQRAFVPEGTGDSFFFKSKGKSNNLAILKLGMNFSPVLNQIYHKQIAITFKKGNSFNYDSGYDSEISERKATDMYWKFPKDGAFYGIAGVQEVTEDLEVPLEIVVKSTQTISINIDEIQNINRPIYIKDIATNNIYNITNTSAKIQLEAGIYSDRFYLVFRESTLGVEESIISTLSNSFKISHDRELKELWIKNKDNSTIEKISVFNLLGQKIIEVDDALQLNKKEIVIKTNALPNSIYIITIETEAGKISKKFF